MTKRTTIIRKLVLGSVEYNDGEFAEIQTSGKEGADEGILLEIIQAHREDTCDTSEEFQRRFPVGARANIVMITEITVRSRWSQVNTLIFPRSPGTFRPKPIQPPAGGFD
jgi:hypothetical protein